MFRGEEARVALVLYGLDDLELRAVEDLARLVRVRGRGRVRVRVSLPLVTREQ